MSHNSNQINNHNNQTTHIYRFENYKKTCTIISCHRMSIISFDCSFLAFQYYLVGCYCCSFWPRLNEQHIE